MRAQPTLFVCLQCGSIRRDENGIKEPNPAAEKLAEELKQALNDKPQTANRVQVQLTRCLSLCTKPIAWGLRATGAYAFTFAPATNPQSMAEVAALWLAAPQGKVAKKQMPEDIRPTLASRLPPLPEEP